MLPLRNNDACVFQSKQELDAVAQQLQVDTPYTHSAPACWRVTVVAAAEAASCRQRAAAAQRPHFCGASIGRNQNIGRLVSSSETAACRGARKDNKSSGKPGTDIFASWSSFPFICSHFALFSPLLSYSVPLQWQAQFLDAAMRHQHEVQALKFQVLSLQDKLAAEVEEKEQLASALDSANTQLAAQKSYEALLTNIGQALRPVGSPRAAAAELGQAPSP
jgi:hypothetical protein